MDNLLSYTDSFTKRIGLPPEAIEVLKKTAKQIAQTKEILEGFTKAKYELMGSKIKIEEALEAIRKLSAKADISEYTFYFIFLVNCTDILLENYKKHNISEQIFWDSMDDFRCKLLECHEVKGVWGTFVPNWYDLFLTMERFALGRFQYEEIKYDGERYSKNGIEINPGDRVYNFHIPSSGKKIDKPARMDSYARAYEFFGCRQKGEHLILVCTSWLLYKEHEKFLPAYSNILDFMSDFDIVLSKSTENFDDSWRVFGKYHNLPLQQWPTDTSLRKAIVDHLLAGGKMGYGKGIIVFDGEKIINK